MIADAKPTNRLKTAVFVAIIFVGLPALGLMLLWKDSCKTTLIKRHVSPDGIAVLDEKVTDCGKKLVPALVLEFDASQSSGDERRERILVAKGAVTPEITWNTAGKRLAIKLPIESILAYAKKSSHDWNFDVEAANHGSVLKANDATEKGSAVK